MCSAEGWIFALSALQIFLMGLSAFCSHRCFLCLLWLVHQLLRIIWHLSQKSVSFCHISLKTRFRLVCSLNSVSRGLRDTKGLITEKIFFSSLPLQILCYAKFPLSLKSDRNWHLDLKFPMCETNSHIRIANISFDSNTFHDSALASEQKWSFSGEVQWRTWRCGTTQQKD